MVQLAWRALHIVATSCLAGLMVAQNCDNTGIVTQSDEVAAVSSTATFSGDASSTAFTIDLTTATSGSFGGFFYNTATAFQGPGGFSSKFSIVNSGTADRGDAWEFIIAGSGNTAFAAPPFATGSPSNGISGWSRVNALVIEFDRSNSGATEQDTNSDHMSVFLAGSEQSACKFTMIGGQSFADGQTYTIWIDFSGFNTQLDIRMSTISVRPTTATVSCSVNIWSVLDISSDYYTGFGAYNDNSGDAQATVMSLTENVYVSDARRPSDAETCAVFEACAAKTVSGLCTPVNEEPANTCTLTSCLPAYQWDVLAPTCCSFVERGAWQADEVSGSNQAGDVVPCSLQRRTIIEEVACGGPVSASPSASPAPSESAIPTPSPSPSVLCSSVCGAQVASLTCDSTNEEIEAAQAVFCLDDTTGLADTCACDGFESSSLDGGGDFDPTNNDNFSNCVTFGAAAAASAHTGRYENMFIKRMDAGGQDSFYIENDIIDTKICLIRVPGGSTDDIEFRSGLTFTNTVFGYILIPGDIVIRVGSTFTNVDFDRLFSSESLRFSPDELGIGGIVTMNDVQIALVNIFDSCIVDSNVIMNVDPTSAHEVIAGYFGTNNCPSPLFDDEV